MRYFLVQSFLIDMMLLQVTLFCSFLSNILCAEVGTRIVGGTEVKNRSEFAYQVLLRFDGRPFCGGSIIDERHVLTAAHCAFSAGTKLEESKLTVVAGSLKLYENTDVKHVTNFFVHENYQYMNDADYGYDIGVIRISGTFQWNDNIQPINLATSPTTSGTCVVSGWGTIIYSDYASMSNSLLYVEVPIVNWNICSGLFSDTFDNRMICAGSDGKDSCQGDSGGPLVCSKNLTGIVSYGYQCAIYPGVYTEVYNYLDWIEVQKTRSLSSSNAMSLLLLLLCSIFIYL